MGVLQGALLPNVPRELNRLHASVAYRPAQGLAAGGDFYGAFPLDRRPCGHGGRRRRRPRQGRAEHTALLAHDARLPGGRATAAPRPSGGGQVLDRGFDTLATVILAVSTRTATSSRYATAGHPPPVFLGEPDHVPVTRASSPPIGAMMPTGLRQTTVSLPASSAACFFTDGLIEAAATAS